MSRGGAGRWVVVAVVVVVVVVVVLVAVVVIVVAVVVRVDVVRVEGVVAGVVAPRLGARARTSELAPDGAEVSVSATSAPRAAARAFPVFPVARTRAL